MGQVPSYIGELGWLPELGLEMPSKALEMMDEELSTGWSCLQRRVAYEVRWLTIFSRFQFASIFASPMDQEHTEETLEQNSRTKSSKIRHSPSHAWVRAKRPRRKEESDDESEAPDGKRGKSRKKSFARHRKFFSRKLSAAPPKTGRRPEQRTRKYQGRILRRLSRRTIPKVWPSTTGSRNGQARPSKVLLA
jgi:hypothetical protein